MLQPVPLRIILGAVGTVRVIATARWALVPLASRHCHVPSRRACTWCPKACRAGVRRGSGQGQGLDGHPPPGAAFVTGMAVGGIAAWAAVVGDRAVTGAGAPGMLGVREAPSPLALPRRLIEVPRPGVAPRVPPRIHLRGHRARGRVIPCQRSGHGDARNGERACQYRVDGLLGGKLVPAALYRDSERAVVLSDGASAVCCPNVSPAPLAHRPWGRTTSGSAATRRVR